MKYLVSFCLLLALILIGYNFIPFIEKEVPYSLCGETFYLDELRTTRDQNKGLMGVKKLDLNKGALFINQSSREMSFWMKNTLIPLDVGFFVGEDLIFHHSMNPQIGVEDKRLKIYSSAPYQVDKAVEVRSGFFKDKYPCKLKKIK